MNAIYFHPGLSREEYSWLSLPIKNIILNIQKIYPSSDGVDYNWLLFRIKNVNLLIKKIYSSSDRVENNFINDFSAISKYQLYFQKNPPFLRRGDYNWDFVMNAIYFHLASSGVKIVELLQKKP